MAGPKFENEARASLASVAATARTFAQSAGEKASCTPSLPAAATTTAPLPTAYETAFCSALSHCPTEPTLRLMTRAPWSADQVIALMTQLSAPEPLSFRAFALTRLVL